MINSWVNGSASASISLTDRGLLYGDGFFTTVSVLAGKPLLWQQHRFRLETSAKRLQLVFDLKQLESDVNQFLLATQLPHRCVLKILVIRAESSRGYHWGENKQANIIFQLFEYTDYDQLVKKKQAGLTISVCKTTLSHNKQFAGLKHLNRLEQVFASSEFDKSQIDEGLMLDNEGWVIEGTKSNIYILHNKHLLTPRLELAGVEGVLRHYMLENFSSNTICLVIDNFKLEQVFQADAIFMSNALLGLCPVSNIVGKEWQPKADKVSDVLTSINLYEASF